VKFKTRPPLRTSILCTGIGGNSSTKMFFSRFFFLADVYIGGARFIGEGKQLPPLEN